jgi:tRNA G18 (ribose-2'-O)-methylase SpoU
MTILVVHNIRSTHNVGSILRTCDGLGVDEVFLTGYTPYPKHLNDTRLPYLAEKINKSINKTALGAEEHVNWHYTENPFEIIDKFRSKGYEIIGLEQASNSININDYLPSKNTVIIIGEELEGISKDLIKICDKIVEIPMKGHKESLNVSISTAIILFKITNFDI